MSRATNERGADARVSRADRLVEVSRDVAVVREVLKGAEERTLAEIATVLAEAAESVARTVEMMRQTQPAEWMDAKQAARYLGKSPDAFEKVVARGEIPRHYLTERNILFSRTELDAWLMDRWRRTGTLTDLIYVAGDFLWVARAIQCPRPLNTSECAVVVNALLILSADPEPDDAIILSKSDGDVADDVFDEGRVVVGLHRDVAFVRALEERIDRRGG
jgi:excisionase family DNA binding protein